MKVKNKSKTNAGKIFENNFRNSYSKLPIYYLRLQDSAKWNRGEQSSFVPDSPYDSLVYKLPFLWVLELKSTAGSSISFNPIEPWEKPKNKTTQVMIKANQVKQLLKANEYPGAIAGLILNFRPRQLKTISYDDETFFMHIDDFVNFAIESKKSGINRDDARELGIKIDSRLLRTNYTYDVEKFCLESPKVYLNKGYINKEDLIRAREYIDELLN